VKPALERVRGDGVAVPRVAEAILEHAAQLAGDEVARDDAVAVIDDARDRPRGLVLDRHELVEELREPVAVGVVDRDRGLVLEDGRGDRRLSLRDGPLRVRDRPIELGAAVLTVLGGALEGLLADVVLWGGHPRDGVVGVGLGDEGDAL
jgi:hypothetical protein